jgi:hypothetical protein
MVYESLSCTELVALFRLLDIQQKVKKEKGKGYSSGQESEQNRQATVVRIQ